MKRDRPKTRVHARPLSDWIRDFNSGKPCYDTLRFPANLNTIKNRQGIKKNFMFMYDYGFTTMHHLPLKAYDGDEMILFEVRRISNAN